MLQIQVFSYTSLVDAYARAGDVRRAVAQLSKMRRNEVHPNETPDCKKRRLRRHVSGLKDSSDSLAAIVQLDILVGTHP